MCTFIIDVGIGFSFQSAEGGSVLGRVLLAPKFFKREWL